MFNCLHSQVVPLQNVEVENAVKFFWPFKGDTINWSGWNLA